MEDGNEPAGTPPPDACKAGIAALDAALVRRAEELELANEELEAFSYSVSHDLRRPLRAITAFSILLQQHHLAQLDAEGQRMLMLIHDSARAMDQLIEDLLRLARLSRAGLRRVTVDLAALSRDVVVQLQRREPWRQVAVHIADPLHAQADAGLLRIVLDNLLCNAWKFSARQPRARIDVGALEHGGTRAFFVRDNGAGFDMRHARRLFLPFQRLHREEEYSGTGIGLATVQRIIHRHDGILRAESAVGHGATFYFTLPEVPHRTRADGVG